MSRSLLLAFAVLCGCATTTPGRPMRARAVTMQVPCPTEDSGPATAPEEKDPATAAAHAGG